MSNIPKDLRYTADHEYARKTDAPGVVQVGITDYAQGELGDIVFVELPKAGATLDKKAVFGTIEAVKWRARERPRRGEPRPLRRRLDDQAAPQEPR